MKDRGFKWLAGMAGSCALLIWANGQHPNLPRDPRPNPATAPAGSEPVTPGRSAPKPHPLETESKVTLRVAL